MSKVVIASNKNKLKKYLSNSTENFKYIFAEDKNMDLAAMLDKKGLSEITQDECSESFKENFCKLYVDFMGKLGSRFNSIYWWTTFTSSKSKFVSKLFPNLFLFNSIVTKLEKYKKEAVLIINVDKSVSKALEKCLRNQNREFVCLEDKIKQTVDRLIWRVKALAQTMAVVCRCYKRKYIANRCLRKRLKEKIKKNRAYYVIKTFIYQRSFDSSSNYFDSFFGTLPDYLKDCDKDVIILGCIFGDYSKIVKIIKQCENFTVIPQEYLISYPEIIKMWFRFFQNTIRIKERTNFLGHDVSDIVSSEIEKDYSNGRALDQFVHYSYTKNLLKLAKVERFILTYENNPWERMCTHALRKYSPTTKIIGYQHTVVPQVSMNVFLSEHDIGVAPLPDKILTVGIITKRIMEHYGYYKNIPIEEACALRFEYLLSLSLSPRSRNGRILVVLEGIQEMYRLVNYVLSEFRNTQDLEIKIREHPAVPFRSFKNKVEYDIKTLSHISLSKSVSVKDDIDSCDMVIYWGSTVALEALMIGKPVINFDNGSLLSYDPLFENKYLKWTVTESDNLRKVVEEIYALSDESFYAQQKEARQYLEKYFYPINEKALEKFLS